MVYRQTSRDLQRFLCINIFWFCIQISSSSKISCETSIDPIELLRPHIFNPSILEVEPIRFLTEIDEVCVLSIRIDYQSTIVRIMLTTGDVSEYGGKQVHLKKYIGLESQTIIKEYFFVCSIRYCNIDYLKMILITGELNWLLRFEDYLDVMSQLRSLLYTEEDIQSANLRCHDISKSKKPILCKGGACEARYANDAETHEEIHEEYCETRFNADLERHYINVDIRTNAHLNGHKKIILRYMCNVDLCNNREVVSEVLSLLQLTNDTLDLFWPPEDSIAFITTTTRRTTSTTLHTSTTIAKQNILSTEKFINMSSVITKITKESDLSLMNTNTIPIGSDTTMMTNILSSSNNRSESILSTTNTDPNYISTVATSTTRMIVNNTSRPEIEMFIYYLLILYSIIVILQ
jgi:hypothetical protein